jgi:hypothetical protein
MVERAAVAQLHMKRQINDTERTEVKDHGKITAGSKERSQEAEEQKEVNASSRSNRRRNRP